MIRSRKALQIGAIVLGALAVLYLGLWFWEAARLHRRVDRYIAARAGEGLAFSSTSTSIGGFPFRLDARFAGVVLRGIPHLPDATAEAPRLVFESRPWLPKDWRFTAPDGVVLTLPAEAGPLRLAARRLEGTTGQGADRGMAIMLRAEGLSLDRAPPAGLALSAAALALALDLPQAPPEDHTGRSMLFDARLERVGLPEGLGPLGSTVGRIELNGAVEGPVPQAPLKAALAAWRDEGGTVELHKALLAWGSLNLTADGTLALDQALQPQAAFSATIRGWPAILDALVAGGALKPDEAAFARLGLSLLVHPGPEGEAELKTPITLQNGHLYLGKAKLAKLPTVTWP